ncbi:hypothetical protein [Bacillus sp. B-jedd]|uniref:hypothetical protein n=1 Tax=Bacillus sp. B-jedd TaxID=1476857 RepID=UPI0005156D8D|nr:hypothetical protein [Bacillus sp. B-jedd]CEG28062.1 hypothetical protein BN1002_02941 [Bacillus sp. B-jedd]
MAFIGVLLFIASISFIILGSLASVRKTGQAKRMFTFAFAALFFFVLISILSNLDGAETASKGKTTEPKNEVAGAIESKGTPSEADTETDVETEADSETAVEDPPDELSLQEQMTEKLAGLIGTNQVFDTGSYIKGDIPTGEYAFVTFDGSGEYYVEKDAAGNIIDNENFESFGYVYVHGAGNLETKGVLISPSAFEALEVTNTKQIYEALNDVQNYKDSAWYKVGTDIQPGTYVIESYGSGYVAVMSGPVGKGDIIDNENFNGKYQVTVKPGQYLKISRGFISQ